MIYRIEHLKVYVLFGIYIGVLYNLYLFGLSEVFKFNSITYATLGFLGVTFLLEFFIMLITKNHYFPFLNIDSALLSLEPPAPLDKSFFLFKIVALITTVQLYYIWGQAGLERFDGKLFPAVIYSLVMGYYLVKFISFIRKVNIDMDRI